MLRHDLTAAIAALKRGGVIAYPTEAVWGLGCDPMDETAVLRLLAIKQRPVDKGLILVASRPEQLDGLVDWQALPAQRREAVFESWPGPRTWVVPCLARMPRWITGSHQGVAVRVSSHPLVAGLCEEFGGPVVSTSANLAGLPAPGAQSELDPALLDLIDVLVPGETGGLDRPTPIRDACTGVELRL